jgi:uncharacterized protein YcaQ
VAVTVDGWDEPAWADPVALETPVRGRHRTTLLSPFDSLIWDRARTKRFFGFVHRLEAYVPKAKRIHGYYAMPLLVGGKLVGRVDPGRADGALVAKQVSVDPGALEPLARALNEAARWIGAESVVVGRVSPAELTRPLETLVAG